MEKGRIEILKKSSKTGDRFKAVSDLENNEDRAFFTRGIGNLVESFQRKSIDPRHQSIWN